MSIIETNSATPIADDVDRIVDAALQRAGVSPLDVWMRKVAGAVAIDGSVRTVDRRIRDGKIRVFRDGGRTLLSVADMRRYIRERLTGGVAA